MTFFSDFHEVDRYAVLLTDRLQGYYGPKMSSEINFHINFVLRELLNNAVEHGNAFMMNKKVTCHIHYDNKVIEISVNDEGPGFAPSVNEVTKINDTGQQRSRGLWLIQQLGLSLDIEGNQVKATYYWREQV